MNDCFYNRNKTNKKLIFITVRICCEWFSSRQWTKLLNIAFKTWCWVSNLLLTQFDLKKKKKKAYFLSVSARCYIYVKSWNAIFYFKAL